MTPVLPCSLSRSRLRAILEAALRDPNLDDVQRATLHEQLLLAAAHAPDAIDELLRGPGWPLVPPATLQACVLTAAATIRDQAGAGARLARWQLEPVIQEALGGRLLPSPLDADAFRPLLTRGQEAVWQHLAATLRVHDNPALRHRRIRPRTNRLIVGPSGVGKSHLLRTFAASARRRLLRLTPSDWIVQGARRSPTTHEILERSLRLPGPWLIHLDELEKAGNGDSDWMRVVAVELYQLLDRISFPAGTESARGLETAFIVGSGTWQNLWGIAGGARPRIGFQPASETDVAHEIRRARVIPTELLNRFHGELIPLAPMTVEDFRAMLAADGIDALLHRHGMTADLAEAVASGQGMRWVENLVLDILQRE